MNTLKQALDLIRQLPTRMFVGLNRYIMDVHWGVEVGHPDGPPGDFICSRCKGMPEWPCKPWLEACDRVAEALGTEP